MGHSLVSLFAEHVLTPIEHYLIGDLRAFRFFTPEEASSGFCLHSFGLLGSAALWLPKSKEELAAVLNQLDTQPNGRSNYRAIHLLTKSSPFLLTDTGVSALLHRKEVLRFLAPNKYVSLIWDLWKHQRASGGDTNVGNLIMRTVAGELLGIELSDEDCDLLRDIAMAFKRYSVLPTSVGLLKFFSEFREEQRRFQQGIEDILEREIRKIGISNPGSTEQGQGLLKQEVIKKMEQNPNLEDLHKDPHLKSLTLSLLALDNLNNALQKMPSKLLELFEEIATEVTDAKVVQDLTTINPSILMDKKKMPVLDRLYQACINPGKGEIILARYVQDGLQCGEHRVPPRTYLAITAPTENRSPLNAFSVGHRSCPGRLVAEALFKTLVVIYVVHMSPSGRNNLKYRIAENLEELCLYQDALDEIFSLFRP